MIKNNNKKIIKHIKCNNKLTRKMIFDYKEQHASIEPNVYYVFDIYKK